MTTSPYSVQRQRREQRHMRLVALGHKDYNAYLSSPHWRSVKARFRASDQPQDCMCGETHELELHHLTYARVGAEELTDLTLLCGKCHAMVHALERRGEIGLDFTGFVNEQRAERNARLTAAREAKIARQAHERRGEHWRRKGKTTDAQLRAYVGRAIKADVDPTEVLDRLSAQIAAADKQLPRKT